jgi:hypothetical protein
MQDEPANAEFVEAMRKDLKGRKALKTLLERPEVQRHIFRDPTVTPRRVVAGVSILLAVGSTLAFGIYVSLLLHSVRPAAAAALVAVFIGICVRRMFYTP